MASVLPFRALRPSPSAAAAVAAVPYDVVSTAEARELARGNPLSFLHVSRAEIDLPEGADPYSDAVYDRALRNYETLKRDAPLRLEDEPSLYVYRLRSDGRAQTGVAGAFSLADYDSDVIRKHERTRRDKEDDRTRHMLKLEAQTGPVFLTYRDRPAIDGLVDEATSHPPLFDFTAPDSVSHSVWRASTDTTRRLASEFGAAPLLYIADGHHRAASASRARQELRAGRSGEASDSLPFDFFLGVAFPASQVRILPYNRVVRDLAGRSPKEFLEALRRIGTVRDDPSPEGPRKGEVHVYLAGRWHALALPASFGGGAIEALDADRLQKNVLEPLLEIGDVRTDKRIDFVGGSRGTRGLEELVDSGRAAVAFAMHPVSVSELMAIADENEIMPPKSTWFEPKLRDGLLIHTIDGSRAS
jgi:uncharacterized protein (DUF1015 family)